MCLWLYVESGDSLFLLYGQSRALLSLPVLPFLLLAVGTHLVVVLCLAVKFTMSPVGKGISVKQEVGSVSGLGEQTESLTVPKPHWTAGPQLLPLGKHLHLLSHSPSEIQGT